MKKKKNWFPKLVVALVDGLVDGLLDDWSRVIGSLFHRWTFGCCAEGGW